MLEVSTHIPNLVVPFLKAILLYLLIRLGKNKTKFVKSHGDRIFFYCIFLGGRVKKRNFGRSGKQTRH